MRSMWICCFVYCFAMEILSLHWRKISTAHRKLPYWRVLESVLRNLRETVTLMTQVLAGRRRRNVRDERLCLIPYKMTHQPGLIVTFALHQDDSLTDQHGVLWVRTNCIRFTYSQCKGCSRGQTTLSTVPFTARKESGGIYVKMNCWHFVKFDNDNNRSDINVQQSYLQNGGEYDYIFFLHFLLQMISPIISLNIVLKLRNTLCI
jgi:hypothetical protein